jgi:hypothetical protein
MPAKREELSVSFRLPSEIRDLVDALANEFAWSRAQVVRRLLLRSTAEITPIFLSGDISKIMDMLRPPNHVSKILQS